MLDMEPNKLLMRAWLKTKRLAMSREEVDRLSRLIQQKLIKEINWHNLKSVSCYQAIESLNEVKTNEIIDFLKQNHASINLAVQSQKPDDTKGVQFDLVIVPTLGYDAKGNRLGWGGGFYDKFLAGQTKALKVGLCYRSGFIKAGLPHEPHDISLDKVITDV
jgi:5-formyltetrahydrofolate cyclo-ligase